MAQDDLDVVNHPVLGQLKFPKSMSPDDRNQIIDGMMAKQPPPPPQSMFQQGLSNLKQGIVGPQGLLEFGKGAAKGALSTLTNIDSMASHVPGLNMLVNPAKIADMQQRAQASNPTQAIGKGTEQAAEFLVPGAGEDALAAKLGGGLAARVGTKALGAGLVNSAQGGSFTAGAAAGGAGEGIASALKAAAPTFARVAMGVRGVDGARAAEDPGAAILSRTTGFSPGTVATQASALNSADMQQLEHMAANRSTTSVNMLPARDAARSGFGTATLQNNEDSIRDMSELNRQLGSRPLNPGIPGKPSLSIPIAPAETSGWGGLNQKPTASLQVPARVAIPDSVPASEALALKRGVGALKSTWDAKAAPDFYNGVVGNVYHALDSEIDRALPGSSAINDRMTTMIPVAQRAAAKDLNAGILERTLGKIGRPTGALVGASAGAYEGGRQGGTPGAIVGGLAGLVAPEIVTNPTTLMMLGRGMNSPLLSKYAFPGLVGLSAQAARKKDNQ